eukprot:g5323.t1
MDAYLEDGANIGDITSLAIFNDDDPGEGIFISKGEGVIAGICVADRIFEITDVSLKVTWSVHDGDTISKGTIIGHVTGSAKKILLAERICLNFLQRMSGIATLTRKMVDEIESVGSKTKLLDTRKTVPGLRLLDKWSVLIGGGVNHRMGLFDMMMIKDNHIAAAGSIKLAVTKAKEYLQRNKLTDVKIEVETDTLDQVQEVKNVIKEHLDDNHVSRVMLDNMIERKGDNLDFTTLNKAIEIMKDMDVELEVSGNVRLETIGQIAATGVTYVSCGALTHSFEAMDISLKIKTNKRT